MSVKPIPEGYHTATPYLAVDDAAEALEYYKKAFGAKERGRMEAPDGKIGHAEIQIGDSLVIAFRPVPAGLDEDAKGAGRNNRERLPLRRERRRIRPAGSRRRRDRFDGGRGSILGRPLRDDHGSVWPLLVGRDPHRGRPSRGDG